MSLLDSIKLIFLTFLILLIAPLVIREVKQQYGSFFESRPKVAVLPLRGIIYDSSFYVKQLQQYFTDPEIKGILLKIECPGTASGTGETIYNEIQTLKRNYPKPVIGLVENVCTAGGYWIACAVDYLIAPGTSIIGNIGSTLPYLFRFKEFIEHYHIKYADAKVEGYQSILNPFVELNPHERELLHGILHDTYQQFIHVVAQARKVPLAKADQWADGKTFTGQQALKLHLIDEVGSPQRVITILKQKALIEGDIKWVYPPSLENWVQTMFGMSNMSEAGMIKGAFDLMSMHMESRYGRAQI